MDKTDTKRKKKHLSQESIEKMKKTCLERYGVEYVNQLPEFKQKRLQTFIDKHPVITYEKPKIEHTLDASELKIYRINKSVANEWLKENCKTGIVRSNILFLGLVKDDVIYTMMAFKKPMNKSYFAELSKMSMKKGYYVTNGYDVLSKYASDLGIYNIVAYVHPSLEDPEEYEKIGMKLVEKRSQRHKLWYKDDKYIYDMSVKKRNIPEEVMLKYGWSCAYDLGTLVYEFKE